MFRVEGLLSTASKFRKRRIKTPCRNTHSFGLASTGGGSLVGESKTAGDGVDLSLLVLPLITPFTP